MRIEPDGPDDVVFRKTIGIDAQVVGFRGTPFAIGKEIVVRSAVLFGFADDPARLVFVEVQSFHDPADACLERSMEKDTHDMRTFCQYEIGATANDVASALFR